VSAPIVSSFDLAAVMYAGRFVETGPTERAIQSPRRAKP
jgi:ABC-type dipeptide/oligopeptide/nickel transport system ATPase component